MNVLSLFDGMSCGQIALNRLGIKCDKYFASEIDKYAIKVTQHNYPDTIQIGDITKVKGGDLPKIDLLLGGSPCSGFSFAGKQLNFDDPRSKLFFEYVRLLEETQPKYFLLENVKMKKESQDIISKHLGVEPIEINSNLVSAQSRRRLYWTNIPNITQPKDKYIILKDIIQTEAFIKSDSIIIIEKYKSNNGLKYVGAFNKIKKRLDNGKNLQSNFSQGERIYSTQGKFPTLSSAENALITENIQQLKYRKPTVTECERLQTVNDNYTLIIENEKQQVSNTQRYKMLGNGWTIDVICHILKNIKEN